jgi:hypothetical protein
MIGRALSQIAALWRQGFTDFEIAEGTAGPVGILRIRSEYPWFGTRT